MLQYLLFKDLNCTEYTYTKLTILTVFTEGNVCFPGVAAEETLRSTRDVIPGAVLVWNQGDTVLGRVADEVVRVPGDPVGVRHSSTWFKLELLVCSNTIIMLDLFLFLFGRPFSTLFMTDRVTAVI